jgi:hypothetical protein
MLKKLLLYVIAMGISLATFAQSIASIQSPQLLPPSPDAAGLGKYAQMPVGKSNGVPDISVPLYEIKTPRFDLPISLSYHASGVKVDESASWVGLEWSLNAGGCISRTMVGVPDDEPGTGFLNVATPMAASLYSNFHADSAYIQNVAANKTDSQPDNFFYNFDGESGEFVFNNLNTIPVLIPYKPLKISFVQGTSGSFTIMDEKGDTYFFNDKETSYGTGSNGVNFVSCWYLSSMISADKSDTISFHYQTDPGIFTDNAYSFTQNIGEGATTGNGELWNLVSTTNTSHCQQIHLSSIQFKGGMVNFISQTGRKDNGKVSLDSVIVSNYDFNLKNINNDSTSYYRLILNGLSENDQNNSAVKNYSFSYNSPMLPPLHNFGQDFWGYYNGYYYNQTLLQSQQVPAYYGDQQLVYTIAGNGLGANRSVSAASMQAGMLTQITYPTGGYTTFTYEPNQYLAPSVTTYSPSVSSVGVCADTAVVSFTPVLPGNQTIGQLVFNINMSKNAQTSFVEVLQGSTVIYKLTGSTTASTTTSVPITVTSGTTYQMMAVSFDNIDKNYDVPLPNSTIGTTYQVTGAPVLTNIGGLRIKTIANYDNTNSLISSERYKYGTAGTEAGVGDFLTASNLMVFQSSHVYQFAAGDSPAVGAEITYSSNSIYPLSSLSGSPVAYEQVTVYHGDTVNNIGKSVYNYTIAGDSVLMYQNPAVLVPYNPSQGSSYNQWVYFTNYAQGGGGGQGIRPIPRLWQNGEPISENHYVNNGNGIYQLVQSKTTSYALSSRPPVHALFLQPSIELAPGVSPGQFNSFVNINDFTFYDYPVSNGLRVPLSTTTTDYGTDGTVVSTGVGYTYGNPIHMYPTLITTDDSKGNTLLKQVLYPQDMVNAGKDPTGIYAAMVAANIISPVIQFTESKNSTQLEQSVTGYGNSNPGSIIEPSSVSLQTMANPAETRLTYNKYDSQGNLLTVSKTDGLPLSYIWGYKGEYPIAEVKNAAASDIFYEGFEGGAGNGVSGDAKTGNYSYSGAYSKTLTGLDNGTYWLTYWQKNGSVWVYSSSQVPVSAGTYKIAPSAQQVDDIRFYPVGAQMTTYTYDPTVGVTSITDAKGGINYYEYDSMQRLMNVRDQYKNIIKSISYNYIGQATSGYIDEPSFKNIAEAGNFTKTGCGTGYTGPTLTYNVPAGTFTSNISQQDANNQAINEVNANGQNYVNTYGGPCLQNIMFTVNNPSAAAGIQITFYGATTTYVYTIPTYGGTIMVPSGTYPNLYISTDSHDYPHHYTLGTRAVIYNSSTSFSNVNIASGSSDLTLTIAN